MIGVVVSVGLTAIGYFAAWAVLRFRFARPGTLLFRTNVRGIEVPVVLGDALVGGALCGIAVLAVLGVWAGAARHLNVTAAVAIALVVMWAAGRWDDKRGDERRRGFKGHLGAVRSRSLTGGLVKIGAGFVAGLLVAALISPNGAPTLRHVAETVALVGLTANLVNLFDRAPGRAGKVALLIAVPLMVLGGRDWVLSFAAVFGALWICLGWDLKEVAMLGDAGANPVGAALGVGLAEGFPESGRLIVIVILLSLNLASEKWSFSKAIEATPPLRWLDGLGRAGQPSPK